MFRFVYACLPNESIDPQAIEGLVGIERAGHDTTPAAEGVKLIGRRAELTTAGSFSATSVAVPTAGYVVLPAGDQPPARLGSQLGEIADLLSAESTMVLIENGGAYRNSPELWRLLEAANHPRVKVAINLARAHADGCVPSRIIPTLNLRIGLVRVRTNLDELTNYARRLAGVGFEGYVVLDPPPGENRVGRAGELAAGFRSIFPAKPAKKAVPAKVAGA